jgi:hypothetical protein
MYVKAIEASRRSTRPTLAGNAALFWLEQELLAGTISPDDAASFLAKLDEAYKSPAYGFGKSVSWIARRRNIVVLLDSMTKRHDFMQNYSNSGALTRSTALETSASKILLN